MLGGRRALAVAGVCALIGAIAIYVTFFSTSSEDRIRKQLDELAKTLSVKDGESIIFRTARLRDRLKDLVADDVSVNVVELGFDIRGRHKLEDDAAKAVLRYTSADLTFARLDIKVDPPQTLATVDGVALVSADRGGERKIDERAIHFLVRNDDGKWRVSSIEVFPPKN